MAERNPSDDQAAFGVFPQLKRNRSQQDREAAKNIPVSQARGMVAGLLGLPADTINMIGAIRNAGRSDKPFSEVPYGSEHWLETLPLKDESPMGKAMGALGSFTPPVGTALKGAKAAGMGGLELINKGMFGEGPLRNFVPQHSFVVKPKGGNWLGGGDQLALPENDLRRLKGKVGYSLEPEKQLAKLKEKYTPEALASLPPELRASVERSIKETSDTAAVNNWIDSNLTNYVKKEMATPNDPVRKLAEEGIIHTPLRNDLDRMEYLQAIRQAEGFPAEGMAQSPLAKQWENLTDDSIRVTKAGKIQDAKNISERVEQARLEMDAYTKELDKNFLERMRDHTGNEIFTPKEAEMLMRMPNIQKAEILGDTTYKGLKENLYELLAREQGFEKRAGELNPFVSKLDPETRLYSGSTYDLGFDHIIDVLKEDVAAGRIRPEQLNKVSMEQAVRRTHEYDQELAKKMNEARLTARADLPVHKEYPEGYKWVQLNRPSDFAAESEAMGHSARGYEPPLGHPDWVKGSGDEGHSSYGLGGWEAIKSGRAKVYSLIDAKGEPHVTIEAGKSQYAPRHNQVLEYKSAAEQEAKQLPNGYTDSDVYDIATRMAKENMPDFINQIKGKQNAKPKEEYLPFVQDFVKGGKWSDVRDFQNSGLIREGGQFMTPAEHSDWLLKELGKDTFDELGLGAKPPPAAGMKRGGVVISNNPDTMMLAVNNQKLAKGGKVVKFVEDVAPAAMEKLAMVFGNKLPLNMNIAEVENLAKRFPEPVVDRVNMAHKDVLKRTPELQEAAARIEAGDMSADEYARLVQRYKPVTPYETVPAPASREEILAALSKTSREAEGLPRKETYFGKPSATLKEGDPVGLRLDIPSYNQANTWVVTAHGPRKSPVSGGAGTRIGYEPVAAATDVDFSVSPKAALGIAKGAEKNTIATMEGKWKPTSSDEAFTLAKQYLKNPEWRQVGMDPERHSFFYDRETMAPVINAEEVIQIGPLVLAKNPKYGKPEDFKYAGGGDVHMSGGGALAKFLRGTQAVSDAERALPLVLPRAMPKSNAEINAHAERVARQMMGEHVTSGKAGDTKNLAGRSMKESQRVKKLEYEIVPTKDVPQSQVYQPRMGDINMALPGDFTLSDVELKSLMGEPIGSRQQGGSRYGLGHMDAETPLFYASNEVPAQGVQNKATDLSDLFGAERIIGQHMAMGPVATNFAQHFADANLRYTDYSKLKPQDMYQFDKIISEGFVTSKKDKKTGETIYKIVDFPDWPGIADPQAALAAMEKNPEMRKFYNRIMQTPKITEQLGLPNGQDVRYAITSPDLRDMEVNLTGHGVGQLVPNAPLTDTAQHNTYSKGIPGMYLGHQEVLTPFAISFPDAAQHIISTKNPQDFTGTIQKVFPHQRVDQQFIDEMEQYRRRIKELTGKKKGGAIKKAAGGAITGDDLIIEERPL